MQKKNNHLSSQKKDDRLFKLNLKTWLMNYNNHKYLLMFNPIISVNIVGIVFPNCSIDLLFPHSVKSELNPCIF